MKKLRYEKHKKQMKGYAMELKVNWLLLTTFYLRATLPCPAVQWWHLSFGQLRQPRRGSAATQAPDINRRSNNIHTTAKHHQFIVALSIIASLA